MINRLFSAIYGNVGSNIQDTSSATATIIKRYINDVYFDVLKRINWKSTDPDYNFTTTAGTQDYILPSNFGKEIYVYDSTNKTEISYISSQELLDAYPSSIFSQGVIQNYTIIDSPVRKQPTASSTLSIFSSSSADTSQVVHVRGENSSGILTEEDVTLNGVTTVPSVGAYKKIYSITKSASSTGTITVNSGSVLVASLAPADLAYTVKLLRFFQIPSSAVTIYVPYIINPYPLTSDYDQPVIDCADVIELGATAKAWRYKRQFDKATDYETQYEKALIQMMWDEENQPNQTHQFLPRTYDRNYT